MDKTPIVLRWWFIVLEVIVFIIAFVAFKVSIILGSMCFWCFYYSYFSH